MLARNIAHAAITAGHSVLVVTASQLLLDLAGQDSARALDRRLRHYTRPALLVVDEIGYLSYDNRNADLLFQIVSRRDEHESLVLTTNLPFAEWSSIFPNAACATALIDRSSITPTSSPSRATRTAAATPRARSAHAAVRRSRDRPVQIPTFSDDHQQPSRSSAARTSTPDGRSRESIDPGETLQPRWPATLPSGKVTSIVDGFLP